MEQFSYLIHGAMLFVLGLVIGLGGALFTLQRRKVDYDELERLRAGDRPLAADLPEAPNPAFDLEAPATAAADHAPTQLVVPVVTQEAATSETAVAAVAATDTSIRRAEPVLSASQSVPVETLRADTLLAAGESGTGDASELTRSLRRALLSGGQGVDEDNDQSEEDKPDQNTSEFQN